MVRGSRPGCPAAWAEDGPQLPAAFMKGVGLSVWQNSADGVAPNDTTSPLSNWGAFVRLKNYFGEADNTAAWTHSNDFWNLYQTHIHLAHDTLDCNSFRFSFEWSRMEPKGPGMVDEAAVQRYHDIIDAIIDAGMEPMCTLHHFTHPQWFEEMGSFEKEENIQYFVDYCKRVFGWFGSKIKLWATFNEPTCFSFVGYVVGLWCPGRRMQWKLCGQVLHNLLTAHVAAYSAIKQMPGGQAACVGLVHQHIRFFPKSNWAPHAKYVAKWMTRGFACKTILRFFTTGVFEWKVPLKGTVIRERCPQAPSTLDWWGINYYSYPVISPLFIMGASKDEEPTGDNDFRIVPEGMYQSIKDASIAHSPYWPLLEAL